jgi:hypothetical protein
MIAASTAWRRDSGLGLDDPDLELLLTMFFVTVTQPTNWLIVSERQLSGQYSQERKVPQTL